MRTSFATVEEGEDLNEVISQLHTMAGLPLPVMRRGQLSGMLTAQNIEEYNRIRRGRLVRLRATPRARNILHFPSPDSLRFPSRS